MAKKSEIVQSKKQIRAKAGLEGKVIQPKKELTSYMPDNEIYRGLYTPMILPRVEEMVSQGYTNKEIAATLGISTTTLWEWEKRHPQLAHSLKKYRGLADIEVENALFKSALGFNFTEVKKERRKNKETGEYEMVTTEEVTKHVTGSPTAQIFYLKNRMASRYKDKVETVHSLGADISALAFAIKRVGED